MKNTKWAITKKRKLRQYFIILLHIHIFPFVRWYTIKCIQEISMLLIVTDAIQFYPSLVSSPCRHHSVHTAHTHTSKHFFSVSYICLKNLLAASFLSNENRFSLDVLTSLITRLIVDYRSQKSINEIQLRENLTSARPFFPFFFWLISSFHEAETSSA